jgi:YfiH family protein
MLQPRTQSGLTFYVSPLLENAGVPHAFSTRLGGVSTGPFASLNLGVLADASAEAELPNVRENYRRLIAAIGCEGRERCWVYQVHGSDVCSVRPGEAFESGAKADALVIDDPARLVSVKYADCVPILLSTMDGRAVAAIHAGWRGVAARVVPAAVARLREMAQPQAELLAAIGPCIGFERFEVGHEVIEVFQTLFGDAAPIRRAGEKGFIDLRKAVRLQLIGCGIDSDRIDTTDRCTARDAEEFYSHRRDGGVTGRMAGIIGPIFSS